MVSTQASTQARAHVGHINAAVEAAMDCVDALVSDWQDTTPRAYCILGRIIGYLVLEREEVLYGKGLPLAHEYGEYLVQSRKGVARV